MFWVDLGEIIDVVIYEPAVDFPGVVLTRGPSCSYLSNASFIFSSKQRGWGTLLLIVYSEMNVLGSLN